MIPGLYFTYGVIVLFTTVNALRRPSPPTSRLPAIWILAMLNGELPLLTLVTRLGVTAAAWWLGAFDVRVGRWGLWLVGISLLGLPVIWLRTWRANRLLRAHASVTPRREAPHIRLTGWARTLPSGLEIVTGPRLNDHVGIDFYRRSDCDPAQPHPTLMYLHGGSWTGGDPHTQSRPLIHRLAEDGWIVATVRYPLSPEATFPDHLIGAKQALAWLRTEGQEAGVDPKRIAVAGASAGAHLAALVSLTPDQPEYQPGFEDVDTSVSACVALCGIYDFLNRNRTRHDWPLIPKVVMKADPVREEARFREASPIDQVTASAPPFLVIHGSHDSLVPPTEARVFVEALRRRSRNTVRYLEVEGAQHAFDAVSSPRSRRVAVVAAEFLAAHATQAADETLRDS
ncbi:MAG: alpha/beta hydrolase [Acidimicrobiales bacterium]|nr:alpha/beta hydrolase [Acidimicrobiales bacterium]